MKFQIEDVIYYMNENRVHSAKIFARQQVEANPTTKPSNPEQARLYAPWGDTRIEYATCHGTINEKDAFESKEALLASL